MQLRLDALETHLAKGLAGLYVVYGDEHLLAQEACDRIRATARAAGYTDRSVFTVARCLGRASRCRYSATGNWSNCVSRRASRVKKARMR
jgi:Fe-S cluster assembly scaffold protein SufB